MKRRKHTAVLCTSLLLAAALSLTSCGGSKDEATPTPSATATPTEKATETATETPADTSTELVDESADLEDVVIEIDGDAMLIASSARYDGNPIYSNTMAMDWKASGVLKWEVDVKKGGRYEISLNYSASDGEGGKGTLQIGNSSAEFETAPTGGVDNLEKLLVMEANLAPGVNTLTITADAGVSANLMNLKRVALVKTSDIVTVNGESDIELVPDSALYGLAGPGNEGGKNIGGWKKDGVVTWQLDVTEGGKYEVILFHSGDTGTGGKAKFEAGGKVLEFDVEPTTGWSDYVETSVGTIVLTAGKKDLALMPTELVGEYFMNAEKVVLRRLGDPAVKIAEDGETTLYPDDAVCAGGAVNQTTDIGGWVEGASATWPIEVTKEGNYEVIVYGAAPDGMGGIGRLSFINMTKEFEIVPTGDWGNYTEYPAGVIGLRAGAYDLLLDGALYHGGWLMNCHKVVLKYVGDFNPAVTVNAGETTVPASACVTAGPGVENNWGNIGGWQKGGKVTWTLDVQEAGTYEFILNHAGDGGTGGHGYIIIGDVSHDINISDTGGWGNYSEDSFGTFEFPQGQVTLTIEAAEDAADWFMNVSWFKLIKQ